tara:strand:- start:131 stop:754 length:624 start_codon:yes stop_codon:yes gene_type:complete
MYKADKVGRIWLDKDTFLAPFGYFKKDWEYVHKFYSNPFIAKSLFHDGMDMNSALIILENQIKNGVSFIGFNKGKRIAFIVLEKVSIKPSVFILHGGISRKLYGSGLPQLALEYVKYFVFNIHGASKLEGVTMHPNRLLERYYESGGLVKECEIKNRVSVGGKLFPAKVFGMTVADYEPQQIKEVKIDVLKTKKKKKRKKRKSKKKR